MDQLLEIWKPVVGYEGLYEDSNLGRVKSLNYNHTGSERVLKPADRGKGYLFVTLCKDGKKKNHLVHRLVAKSFIPNPLSLPQVNHKDCNPQNNRVENLEWCTQEYNINYGTRNEKVSRVLTNHPSKSKPVLQYTLDGQLVREWPSAMEAGRNSFNQGAISACCRGELTTYKGYKWVYKD